MEKIFAMETPEIKIAHPSNISNACLKALLELNENPVFKFTHRFDHKEGVMIVYATSTDHFLHLGIITAQFLKQ